MNRRGFVMIETVVVTAVLSLGLITLYASYSLILSKATIRSNYDNLEYIYKTYFVNKYLRENNLDIYAGNFITYDESTPNVGLQILIETYNIEKIYLSKAKYASLTQHSNLINYDVSTIGYLRALGDYDDNKNHIIVKYVSYSDLLPNMKIINFASLEY